MKTHTFLFAPFHCASFGALAAAIALISSAPAQTNASAEATRFDVNDVSFLWPVPKSAADVAALISLDDKLDNGEEIMSKKIFDQLISHARTVQNIGSGGHKSVITLPDTADQRHAWKVAGIRVHPSALGTSEKMINDMHLGSAPGIRLIVQPVTMSGSKVKVHDLAAHVVFNFLLNPSDKPLPSIPDATAFGEVLKKLKEIKKLVEAVTPTANVPLGIHPGFTKNVPHFRESLRELLNKNLSGGRLDVVSFMGIDSPEPWIFFSTKKTGSMLVRQPVRGSFEAASDLMNGQIFTVLFGDKVFPATVVNSQTGEGVGTASLFKNTAMSQPMFPGTTKPELQGLKLAEIADRIANPEFHNNLNTDCVSCHTESTRRRDLHLPASVLAFARPQGTSGVEEKMLPAKTWNVRNFGWGFLNFSTTVETISQRAANEAAASADFINRKLLPILDAPPPAAPPAGMAIAAAPAINAAAPVVPLQPPQPPQPPPAHEQRVANPLTLVLDIKDGHFVELKKALEDMQGKPPEQNASFVALQSLGLVHFARFAFIKEEKVMVITDFDGKIEDYVAAFANKMGGVFDLLLSHVKEGPPSPVKDHQDEFLTFVLKHDLKCIEPFYSAYPKLTVQDILTLQKRAAEKAPQAP